ncbi:MAG: glutamate synthase large subunit [Pseudomonadota bacterium]|nr:glutamate synthase large subunit [Pseudomonadota bacterium]
MRSSKHNKLPERLGLYDPSNERDSCGVGFIANIKGIASHEIIQDANHLLCKMDHRGAAGSEKNSGDGAGILTALPHDFLEFVAKKDLKVNLPKIGQYAAGNIFLPKEKKVRDRCKSIFEKICKDQKQKVLGWRRVPVDPIASDLGKTAREAAPVIEQVFISSSNGNDKEKFERQLYLIRKYSSSSIKADSSIDQLQLFYICSLSTKVIIYKGMLIPEQILNFYKDLRDPLYKSHLAMVHSRFSTNTFPSWDRAQPFRFMSHNGEINTLRGNVNLMSAREGVASSKLLGKSLEKVFPVVEPDVSDSGAFDNVLEFLLMNGRTLQESITMMIPEAWQKNKLMDKNRRAFYEYLSCLMEPWDGPASIAFTDGKYIGAVLDRNGLRPSRYYLTHDDRVIMASEVGVIPVDPSIVKAKGRLEPGKMFLIDFEKGRLVPDKELKSEFSSRHPFSNWIDSNRITLDDISLKKTTNSFLDKDFLVSSMKAFGYTKETMQFMLLPLIRDLRDPVGSMGNDSSLACLSDRPRMLYDYFKQLFAQVTNPPIDSIREEIVMSLECYIGPEGNLLDSTEEHCQRLKLPQPILSNHEMESLIKIDYRGWKSRVIDITYSSSGGSTSSYISALDRICKEAEEAIDQDYKIIILSDRLISKDRISLSSLAACGAVHHHLVKKAKRTRIGMVLETGEAREVHHHCLLIGYGADAINPYIAFESLNLAKEEGLVDESTHPDYQSLVSSYIKGVNKGMLKVMAKMGISTLQSYKGAQIFEALGLADDVVERCFTGTASRLQGVNFSILEKESLRRHQLGFSITSEASLSKLPNPGEFHWRSAGEKHSWNPTVISSLQAAAKTGSKDSYKTFSDMSNDENKSNCTLRGLLRFKKDVRSSIRLDQVEPAAEIVKRFCTGAMSFGSISSESHESLAIAMNRLGGKSNTGEGGEDPDRFKEMPSGDSRRSSIKQIASGRFGVTAWYLTNADELQIKMAQGAKPGEGGELPGRKVDEVIAKIRYSTPGVGLISPPPHHDIYSIEDLAQLIHDLKNSNPKARISVKLVSEVGVGTIAAGVAKAHADHILISGDSGGTGASPLTSIKHAGLPLELGIAETHQTLVLNKLRSRVVLQTDGGLKTGRDVVIAAMLGAEEMGFSTGPLITLGCIMMRKCHLNTCPVGIATQDPVLRKKFSGKPEYVVNYLFMVAEEAREIMADLGISNINDLIGRTDLLESRDAIDHWKSDGLDLTPILEPTNSSNREDNYCTVKQEHGLEKAIDNKLIELSQPAIHHGSKVTLEMPIVNTNRAVGTMLSHYVVKTWGERSLPINTINIKFNGSAGQSFGAFLARGITLELEGDSNDYVGKGLSGGRVIIYPPEESSFVAEDNILIGNVALYGATAGRAFFRGVAAERFCVRNSGAKAVVEGVGDHGCEYMTGGRAVILGPTGRNFAAGMSGGIAYVWDIDGKFKSKCNLNTVDLDPVEDENDLIELRELVEMHKQLTNSAQAEKVLDLWPDVLSEFVKVMPTDYKRVLAERKKHDEETEVYIDAKTHSPVGI